MNSQTKNEYMLLFRGTDWYKGLSAEEMQEAISQMMAWFKRLTEQGKCIAGSPLDREGKVLSGKNGRVISDGPFAESKEAIAGYFLLQVDSLEEAVAVAKECPTLAHGAKVEVRQVLDKCPVEAHAACESSLTEVAA